MKKLTLRLLAFMLVAACAGCAAHHTPVERAAVDRAEGLNFTGGAEKIANPSVIVPHKNLTLVKVDGKQIKDSGLPGKNVVFVSPGRHILSVLVDTGMYVSQSTNPSVGRAGMSMGFSSKVALPEVNIESDFESGKHYNLNYDMGWSSTEFTFTEITDAGKLAEVEEYLREYSLHATANAADLDSYLAFSRQSPGLLEGRWRVGNDGHELEFTGSKVKWTAGKIVLFSSRPSLSGRFYFDQDTLVTVFDEYDTMFKIITRDERPDAFPTAVWHYTLDGDTLEIKRGGMKPQEIGGTYKRLR